MSSVPVRPMPGPANDERRSRPRRRLDKLAYIGFGPDTGGVLLDISEEGLRCQIVGSVVEGDSCHLKFALPGRRLRIEVDGQVVWTNNSRQGGGVRLIGLRPDALRDLQQWIHDDIAAESIRGSVPIPIRTRNAAAGHVPKPAAQESVAPTPAARDATASPEPKLRVVPASSTRKVAVEARRSRPKAAQKAAVAKKTASQPAQTTPVAGLFELSAEHRTPLSTKVAVLAGCVIVGLAALAYSGFDPASLLSQFVSPNAQSGTVAPPAAPPARSVIPSSAPVAEEQPAMASRTVADNLSNRGVPVASNVARPEVTPANPARAARPAQVPKAPAVAPANHRSLALVLPRPRSTRPEPPSAALPEIAAAPIAPSIDLSVLENRPPEPPAQVKPQVVYDYRPPQLVSRVEPVYSAPAKQARLQGTVTVDVTVGADGSARSTVCASGNTLLCRMAIDAISRWHYQPATSNGLPVAAQTRVSFNFQLQ